MPTCRICLHEFTGLRFQSSRISVCGKCVNTLNESHDVAENAERRIGELLLRGMERNGLRDIESSEPWQKAKAERTLSNIDRAHTAALPQWLNKVLASPENTRRDFKLLRAHRRGLLHYDQPAGWGYPNNWKEVASRIRQLDGYKCAACAAQDQVIDVHHIVYVSNFGTHQQSNLISLCRKCHETEHKRSFDLGEAEIEQVKPATEVAKEVDRPALVAKPPRSMQLDLPVPIQTQLQLPPNSISQRQSPSAPPPPPPPTPNQLGLSVAAPQTNTNNFNSRTAQRYCGYCRTLVVPRRRYLLLKQCPNCEHAI